MLAYLQVFVVLGLKMFNYPYIRYLQDRDLDFQGYDVAKGLCPTLRSYFFTTVTTTTATAVITITATTAAATAAIIVAHY